MALLYRSSRFSSPSQSLLLRRRVSLNLTRSSFPRHRYASSTTQSRGSARSIARSIGMYGCAFAALGIGFYTSRIVFFIWGASSGEAKDVLSRSADFRHQSDVTKRYNHTAPTYDSSVDAFESISGINRIRRNLISQARGRVLEAGVGTGRNMQFYDLHKGFEDPSATAPSKVESIVFVDTSREMMEIARKKWGLLYGSGASTDPDFWSHWRWNLGGGRVKWWCGSVLNDYIPPPTGTLSCPDSGSDPQEQPLYDTVVQTLSLCSTTDPVAHIRSLALLAHPDRGRVLLLEHGRGYYNWLNAALDRAAPAHAQAHGCWWNRDIGALLDEAGVVVKKVKRRHLGTLWEVEIEPIGWEERRRLAAEKETELTQLGGAKGETDNTDLQSKTESLWNWFRGVKE